MSHVWEYGPAQGEDGIDREVTVTHNGDWSGDATITIKTISTSHSFEFKVPGKILKSLVVDLFRDEMIAYIENWDPTER